MASVQPFIEKTLRLKVNEKKSAVDRPWKRKFLGFSFTSHKEPKVRIAKESLKRMKNKIREINIKKDAIPNGISNSEIESIFNWMVWIFCISRYEIYIRIT